MTTQENNELEQMRRQMAILQGKLDKETIVNKRLMRESMKNSYSSINNFLKFQQFVCLPIILIGFPLMNYFFHLSWGPIIAIWIIDIASIIFDAYTYKMKDAAFLSGDLVNTAIRLQHAKKICDKETALQIPVLLIWFVWFIADFIQKVPNDDSFLTDAARGGIIGAFIGLICGVIAALHKYREQQRTRQTIIDQIHDLNAGN